MTTDYNEGFRLRDSLSDFIDDHTQDIDPDGTFLLKVDELAEALIRQGWVQGWPDEEEETE